MAKKRRILILGPSGSGKSTLVDHLRAPEFDDQVVIPKRVITLPLRADSNATENRNVSKDQFRREVEAGNIKPWWERRFGDDEDAQHFYGFERVAKKDPRIRLFLGNNALVGAKSPQIQRFVQKSLVVIVHADPVIRGDRIDCRLPGMESTERAQRISDGLASLDLLCPQGVVTLDTSNQDIHDSQQAFTDIVFGRTPAQQLTSV